MWHDRQLCNWAWHLQSLWLRLILKYWQRFISSAYAVNILLLFSHSIYELATSLLKLWMFCNLQVEFLFAEIMKQQVSTCLKLIEVARGMRNQGAKLGSCSRKLMYISRILTWLCATCCQGNDLASSSELLQRLKRLWSWLIYYIIFLLYKLKPA